MMWAARLRRSQTYLTSALEPTESKIQLPKIIPLQIPFVLLEEKKIISFLVKKKKSRFAGQTPKVTISGYLLTLIICSSELTRSVWVCERELCFLQEKKKKKKYTCDKLCYQETTHHYPWAWGSVSRNESNRKSTVGERNGRAWPVERDHAGVWMLERLAKLWLKAIVKTVERKWLRFQTSMEERKEKKGEKKASLSLAVMERTVKF